MTFRPLITGGLVLGVAACGLSVVGQGLAEDGATPDAADARAADGSTPSDRDGGAVDARPPFDAAAVCDAGLPTSGVIVLPPPGGGCPSGTTEQVVQTSPVAAAGACTCGTCTPATAPSCAGDNLEVTWGGTNACATSSAKYDVTDGTCIDWGYGSFDLVAYHGWQKRNPTAGTCTAAKIEDASKVTTTALRTCAGAPAEAACSAVLAGARVCIEADGGACAAPFSETIHVGDGTTLACADCGCAHTATKCTVEYHGNSSCTQLKYTTEANGVCARTNDAKNVEFFKVTPTGVTCTATPGAASVSLTNTRTLCCTP